MPMTSENQENKGSKLFRRILKAVLVVVGVIVVGAVVLVIRLDSIARVGIEKSMSWALQVPVSVEDVHVGILSGEAQIRGLVIGNPEGYKTAQAFSIEQASARVDIASFRTDEPVIYEIVIQAPDITLEQGLTESNLSRLAKNTSRFSKGDAAQTEESSQSVKIERLVIEKGKVGISSPVLEGQAVPVLLPPIKLTDLGGKKDTPATAEALGKVFIAILEGVAESGKGLVPDETLKSIQTSMGGIRTLGDELKKSGEQVDGEFRKAGDEVKGVLKGLIPAKKETKR